MFPPLSHVQHLHYSLSHGDHVFTQPSCLHKMIMSSHDNHVSPTWMNILLEEKSRGCLDSPVSRALLLLVNSLAKIYVRRFDQQLLLLSYIRTYVQLSVYLFISVCLF